MNYELTVIDIGKLHKDIPMIYGLFRNLRSYITYPQLFFLVLSLTLLICISFILHESINQRKSIKKYLIFTNVFISFFILLVNAIFFQFTIDDVLGSLVHSKNLMLGNGFSYYSDYLLEGTVESVFFMLCGLLGHTGIPIETIAAILSFLFSIGCLLVMYLIIFTCTSNHIFASIGIFLMALNTTFIYSVFSMYSTTLLGFVFLLSVLFWLKKRFKYCLICFGQLPIIRAEYFGLVLIICLFYIGHTFFSKKIQNKKIVFSHLLCLVWPTIVMTTWRLFYYGHSFPIPFFYKGAIFDFESIFHGLLNFLRYTYEQPFWLGLISIILILYKDIFKISNNDNNSLFYIFIKNKIFPLIFSFIAIFLFSIPYIINDQYLVIPSWFRYLLPMTLLIYPLTIILQFNIMKSINLQPIKPNPKIILKALICFSLTMMVISGSMPSRHSRRMADYWNSRAVMQFYWGEVIERVVPKYSKVATTEIGALAFFHDIYVYDLTGLLNKDIAFGPVKGPNNRVNHRWKRNNPLLIEKRRPEILAPAARMIDSSNVNNYISSMNMYVYFWQDYWGDNLKYHYGEFENVLKAYNPYVIIGRLQNEAIVVHLLVRKDFNLIIQDSFKFMNATLKN